MVSNAGDRLLLVVNAACKGADDFARNCARQCPMILPTLSNLPLAFLKTGLCWRCRGRKLGPGAGRAWSPEAATMKFMTGAR